MRNHGYTFETFFRNLTAFERLTAFQGDNPFQLFFPHDVDGELLEADAKNQFKGWAGKEPDMATGVIPRHEEFDSSPEIQFVERELEHIPEPERPAYVAQFMRLCSRFPAKGGSPGTAFDRVQSFGVFIYGGDQRDFSDEIELRAPIYFGRGVRIRRSARIIGPTMIGDGDELYGSSLITKSVVRANTIVNDGAQVRRCRIGSRVYIGANVLFPDRLPPGSKVRIPDYVGLFEERHRELNFIELPNARFGSIIGDGCHVGDGSVLTNVCLLPKTIIPNGTVLGPGVYNQQIIDLLCKQTDMATLIADARFHAHLKNSRRTG